MDDDNDVVGRGGYDDSRETVTHTPLTTQPAVGHTFSSARTRAGSQILAFQSVLEFRGHCYYRARLRWPVRNRKFSE